jgi:hypothetical protein
MSLLYNDVTSQKALIGSDLVFSCESVLTLRASECRGGR